MRSIVILGGGISGLSAAWYLGKRFPRARIELFEASDRLGGWIESKAVGPFLFELGPRTFRADHCPMLLQMCKDLNLDVVHSQAKGVKYLWYRGKLRSLGSFWPTLLRACIQDLVLLRSKIDDESIYDFAKRRMGKKATEVLIDAMAKGVYGGDIRKLSCKACFPSLFGGRTLAQKLLRTKTSSLFTLRQGMESLIEALSAALPIEIHLNAPVERIDAQGIYVRKRLWPADLIISALPAPVIAHLTDLPLQLRYEPITVVNFGFSGDILSQQGYGYLVPSVEQHNLLGQVWDTSVFPVPGQTKITSMVRGANPIEIATRALADHLRIHIPPAATIVKEAQLPQYDVGHSSRIEQWEKAIDTKFQGKLKLTGNYLFGVSVESCLQRSLVVLNK